MVNQISNRLAESDRRVFLHPFVYEYEYSSLFGNQLQLGLCSPTRDEETRIIGHGTKTLPVEKLRQHITHQRAGEFMLLVNESTFTY